MGPTASISPVALIFSIALIFSMGVPMVAFGYHFLAIRLLLIHEGVKSPFSIFFPHEQLLDLQRIRTNDTSGLSLSGAERFDKHLVSLRRSFRVLGAWLIVVFVALCFLM